MNEMKKPLWEYIFDWTFKIAWSAGIWLLSALVVGVAGGIAVKVGRWVYEIL